MIFLYGWVQFSFREEASFNVLQNLPQNVMVGFLHCCGCICTNIGFGYGSASLVQVIKLLEPIETLLLTALLHIVMAKNREGNGTISKVLSLQKVLATLIIIAGASMLLGQDLMNPNAQSICFAVLSGLCMSARNVLKKKGAAANKEEVPYSDLQNQVSGSWGDIFTEGMVNFSFVTIFAAIPALVMVFLSMVLGIISPQVTSSFFLQSPLLVLIQAVVFHCLYNIASITVLSLTSAPVHSLLNVGKRIVNVLWVALVFGVPLSQVGQVGLVFAAFGTVLYTENMLALITSTCFGTITLDEKKKVGGKHRRHKLYRVLALVVGLSFSSLATFHVVNINISSETKNSAKRKVVLLGPHDRYNFGDLLFSKVITKLLIARAQYSPEDILMAGIISVNMLEYGGWPNIISMKKIQDMSRNDFAQGPYDIVYTGGEAAGCSHSCGVSMLPSQFRELAKQEQISDCAYLVPKAFLLPFQMANVTNHAIANSMGGNASPPDCKKALATADYVSYRDKDRLAPDSAVMTKELFQTEIHGAAQTVLRELFPAKKEKYVAVQIRSGSISSNTNQAELAKALDSVSRHTNTTVVFFAAGTCPGHDLFPSYKEVANRMKEPNIVYEAEHIWKVVALISEAEVVFSTSLHVRIMAFIHFKPRITWCGMNTKHSRFIDLWDKNDSPNCFGNNYQKTLSVLQKYYDHGSKVQSMTMISYKKAVHWYLESFDTWSAILSK